MYEIEEALKRIEKNTYGVCELTGNQFPRRASKQFRGAIHVQAQAQWNGGRSAPTQVRRVGKRGCRRRNETEEEGDEPEEKPKEKE